MARTGGPGLREVRIAWASCESRPGRVVRAGGEAESGGSGRRDCGSEGGEQEGKSRGSRGDETMLAAESDGLEASVGAQLCQ
nr:unnamed protein product [Digitaria exilis]